jgi:hypothetical protein
MNFGPSGLAVQGAGLRPLVCWDCGFESRGGRGCLSVVSVVCCQVEVSATSWSLVQRSVVRRCVWFRNLQTEEALACTGPQRHNETRLYKRIRKKYPDCMLGGFVEALGAKSRYFQTSSLVISNVRIIESTLHNDKCRWTSYCFEKANYIKHHLNDLSVSWATYCSVWLSQVT